MEKIIEKISSYNLFNNLLPGAIYAVFIGSIGRISLMTDNMILNFFLFYCWGVVIGRFGSVVIEGLARKFKIVRYAEYSDFITASEKDKKLETLLEMNNIYRTFIALFFIIGVTELYKMLIDHCAFLHKINGGIILVILIALFVVAFRKQTIYINNRVVIDKENENK
jgi:hypothetical protein